VRSLCRAQQALGFSRFLTGVMPDDGAVWREWSKAEGRTAGAVKA